MCRQWHPTTMIDPTASSPILGPVRICTECWERLTVAVLALVGMPPPPQPSEAPSGAVCPTEPPVPAAPVEGSRVEEAIARAKSAFKSWDAWLNTWDGGGGHRSPGIYSDETSLRVHARVLFAVIDESTAFACLPLTPKAKAARVAFELWASAYGRCRRRTNCGACSALDAEGGCDLEGRADALYDAMRAAFGEADGKAPDKEEEAHRSNLDAAAVRAEVAAQVELARARERKASVATVPKGERQ